MTNALAEILGLTEEEYDIYKDYQDNGCPDGNRLMEMVRNEVARRARGEAPITGAMVREMMS